MKIYHFHPSKKKNSLLYKVVVVVAIVQVLLFLTFATAVISRNIFYPTDIIETPPPAEVVDKSALEQKVRVRENMQKSTKTANRITVTPNTNIAQPDVVIDLPSGSVDIGGFSTITDSSSGPLKIAPIDIVLMDVASKGERIIICIDAGSHLMTMERGGLDTYKVIREEIKRLVDSLPGTVLFNLMAFDTRGGATINLYRPGLVPADDRYKKGVAKWIDPINASLNQIGAGGNNYTLKFPFLPQPPASSGYSPSAANIYRIYQAALEQGADTIYILTTGWVDADRVMKPWTEQEIERYRKVMEKYEADKERELKKAGWTDDKQLEYEKKVAVARTEAVAKARKWLEEENAKLKKAGKSQIVESVDQIISKQKLMPKIEPAPPKELPRPKMEYKSYGRKGLADYYEPLMKEYYDLKKIQRPTVNMIVFKGPNEEWTADQSKVVRAFTSTHRNGTSRVLRGLKPVAD